MKAISPSSSAEDEKTPARSVDSSPTASCCSRGFYETNRLPRRHKLLVAGLIPYLAMPFDLVPDFIPVAGQLDDAGIVAFILRRVARKNPDLIREHWRGPASSLDLILRLAGQ
jgi:uncharacterized membrane protein YkvA (DUF1232 family)